MADEKLMWNLIVDRYGMDVTLTCSICKDPRILAGTHVCINEHDDGGMDIKSFIGIATQEEVEQAWEEHLELYHKNG